MSRPRSWTDGQLIQAIQQSKSLTEVIRKLGLPDGGNTYKTIRERATELGLDLSRYPQMAEGRPTRVRRWIE